MSVFIRYPGEVTGAPGLSFAKLFQELGIPDDISARYAIHHIKKWLSFECVELFLVWFVLKQIDKDQITYGLAFLVTVVL